MTTRSEHGVCVLCAADGSASGPMADAAPDEEDAAAAQRAQALRARAREKAKQVERITGSVGKRPRNAVSQRTLRQQRAAAQRWFHKPDTDAQTRVNVEFS